MGKLFLMDIKLSVKLLNHCIAKLFINFYEKKEKTTFNTGGFFAIRGWRDDFCAVCL